MKSTLTFLFSFLVVISFAKTSTYERLCTVNKCWKEQKDIDQKLMPHVTDMTERSWIELHLALVEKTLRARPTDKLTTEQKQNRLQCLAHLHAYWLAGNFPVNEDYKYRTPIFIDKHDNFCAVGYLLKTSGSEAIARKIAATTNLAYVKDIKYSELQDWADANGFSVGELAWIQPGYPPNDYCVNVGKGVDGVIQKLYADTVTNRLYAGGSFTNADSDIVVNNIAYVTGNSPAYTWHSMGTGVSGTVKTILRYAGRIYVGGYFTGTTDTTIQNIAYWDDTTWHSAGCLAGAVNDLLSFGGSLYAAGYFASCDSVGEVNFAVWNGGAWQPIPGLNGTVNKMQLMDTSIVLGGAFAYGGDTVNVIKWSPAASFQLFASPANNEIMDIEVFHDSLYAGCQRTSLTDSTSLLILRDNTWQNALPSSGSGPLSPSFAPYGSKLSFNTLCAETSTLNIGGQFYYNPGIGDGGQNAFNGVPPSLYGTDNWFLVDSAINTMVMFNGDLYAGGQFRNGNGIDNNTPLNGIAKREVIPEAVNNVTKNAGLSIYPNPAHALSTITIESSFNATKFTIMDMQGRSFSTGAMQKSNTQHIAIPQLSPGSYLLQLSNDNGYKEVSRLTIL